MNISRIGTNETARFLILKDAKNIQGKSLSKMRETRGSLGESKKQLGMKRNKTEGVPRSGNSFNPVS